MPFWRRGQGKRSEGEESDQPRLPITSVSQYGLKLLYEPDEPELAKLDILFVHGLDGHREKSWMAEGADSPWPKALLPQKLPQARVLTYGYDARYVGWSPISTNMLVHHATTMLHNFVQYRANDNTHNRPLLFVAHSLGGLVCIDALVSSSNSSGDQRHLRTISDHTRGIAFLGTPHSGSAIAKWGELVRKTISPFTQTNKQILAVLMKDSEALERVQTSFHAMIRERSQDEKRAIAITCFYEELSMAGVGYGVVSRNSAELLGYPAISIRGNHVTMTKFKDEDDQGFRSVYGELQRWAKDFCNANGGLSTIPFQHNPEFLARQDVLREIDEKLKSSPKRRIALYGLGGIGKTQILLQYGFKRFQSALSTSVFWVSASSCSSFRKSYDAIATKLKLFDGQENAPADVLQLVKETLDSKRFGEWILIVDDADDLPNWFTDHPDGRKKMLSYLPENSPNPILYSTRSKTAARQLVASGGIIWVQPLNGPDSASLLEDRLKRARMPSTRGEGWAELLYELEYLPLAIVQAASYMTENAWTVPECLQHHRASKLAQMLKYEFRDTTREEQCSSGEETDQRLTNAIASIFTTLLSKVESQDPYAAELLCLMAIYGTTNIPKEILQETQDVENDVRFGKSVGTLTAFSLVSIMEEGKSFRVHRLVQRSIRDWLICQGQFKPWVSKAVTMISKHFPSRLDYDEDVKKALELHAHIPFDSYAVGDPGDEKYAACELFMKCSTFHGCTERLEHCIRLAQLACEFARLHLPEDSLAVLSTNIVMAKALFTHGKYDEAEEVCIDALRVYSEEFGFEGMVAQEGFHLIGSISHARGEYKEAFQMHGAVVHTGEKNFGLDDTYERGKLTSMALSDEAWRYNVALFYDRKQRDDPPLREALKWTIEHKGADSRAARIAMTDLASAIVRWNLDKAWELNEEALRLKGEPLDPSDPPTRENLRIRTLVLYGRNENAEAERWARVVVESSEKALGLKHPKTLEHAFLLALVLIAGGKYQDAEEFASRAYEGYTELYDSEDMFTKDSRIILEVILSHQRRWGYRWSQLTTGFWSKDHYSREECDGQRARVKVAEELPYVIHRFIKKGVELTDEDLKSWRNYSLLKRLPRRQFPGYVTGTLQLESRGAILGGWLFDFDFEPVVSDDPANTSDNLADAYNNLAGASNDLAGASDNQATFSDTLAGA